MKNIKMYNGYQASNKMCDTICDGANVGFLPILMS